jgi:PAS domain S-box-containing protein
MSPGGFIPEFVDALHVGMWSSDQDGVTTYVNRRVVEMLTVPADEIVGRPVLDFFPEHERANILMHLRQRRDQVSDHYDVHLQRPDGSLVPVRVSGSPLMVNGEFKGSVAAVTDLSDVESAADAMERALRSAEAASLSAMRLLSWVSHELRTPLNAISGFAQLLEQSVSEPSQRAMASSILAAGTHVNGLAQDLLDYSKAEAGMLEPDLTTVAMRDVLDRALSLSVTLARENDVTLEMHVADECVVADQRRLVQSVLNLLSNAIKYGGRGSRVVVQTTSENDRVRCSVTDEGPGIPPSVQQRAFTAFERLDNASNIDGVGLGLSIADSYVRSMHGSLTVSSPAGAGATFTIELPAAGEPTGQPTAPGEAKHSTNGLVLYVEDEPLNASLVESIIGLLPGRTLHVEPTVAGGIEAADRLRPALVLLDLNLPDGSGFDVLAAIRANPALTGVPVFILSADATEQTTAQAMQMGADRFISKPFNLKEFVALVEAAT